jgi:hypothetical protein
MRRGPLRVRRRTRKPVNDGLTQTSLLMEAHYRRFSVPPSLQYRAELQVHCYEPKKEPTQPMRSAGSSRRRRETTGEKCYFAPTLSWCRLSSYSFYVDAIYRFDWMCRIDRTYLIVQTYRIDRFARSCRIGRCRSVRSCQIDRCRSVRSCQIVHYRSVQIPH